MYFVSVCGLIKIARFMSITRNVIKIDNKKKERKTIFIGLVTAVKSSGTAETRFSVVSKHNKNKKKRQTESLTDRWTMTKAKIPPSHKL